MPLSAEAFARPHIIIADTEAEQLSALALQMEHAAPLAAGLLLEEIDRAEIRPDGDMPDNVVRMRSIVQFEDDAHGARRTVLLVYPSEADIAAGKISVLTPVGAGLIGLSTDQEIQWPDRDGHERALRILKVRQPARLAF
jgi:regulator of nucleoside diphosphate kinase